MPSGNQKNGRFVPYITKWQLSREDLDGQHREREDISLLRARWLPVPLLTRWVDQFGS
jgi:hypothetical protein